MEFPQEPDLIIERDADGVVRELRHLQAPAIGDPDQSIKAVALAYLRLAVQKCLLPLDEDDLEHLAKTIGEGRTEPSENSRFRWANPRELKRDKKLETAIVWCQQTVPVKDVHWATDLEGCSIRLVLHSIGRTFGVTSARSTVQVPYPFWSFDERRFFGFKDEWIKNGLKPREAAQILGLPLGFHEEAQIIGQRIVAFAGVKDKTKAGPAMSAAIVPIARSHSVAHRLLYDFKKKAVVEKSVLASACAGYAFLGDPASKRGDFTVRPDNSADILDAYHDPVSLMDLEPAPGHPAGGRRQLSGPRVTVRQASALGEAFDPPTQKPPFAFTARSNEFAAVSAYYHCDSMVRLVADFGFDLSEYFQNIELPLTVEHRAKLLSGSGARDGRGINAYVTPFMPATSSEAPWNARMLFGLADFADTWKHPLGLAADAHFIWHEFSHVLILAATGSTEFGFAHSVGDGLAAVMSDPSSRLDGCNDSCRGVTFPFVSLPMRRHDRDVEDGWGWNGTLYEKPFGLSPLYRKYGVRDPAGYYAEQILSSTVFRLYGAIGGDATAFDRRCNGEPDVDRRRAAAHYTAYLIVRAIASLGLITVQPTNDAEQFATALMDADVGTVDFAYEGAARRGGMVHKVLRWAFERQGLYQAPGEFPQNRPGEPPAIDVFIDDGRRGEYQYVDDWSAEPDVMWVARNVGGASTQPSVGQINYVYVAVGNRGSQSATQASVKVFTATGADADTWNTNGAWRSVPSANAVQTADVSAGGLVIFGPFEWTPPRRGRHALLAAVTVSGDRSNIDMASALPCATGPVALLDLVACDNNLGYREWELG